MNIKVTRNADLGKIAASGGKAGGNGVLSVRPISAGTDWRVSEFNCQAGPSDRPFEERHDAPSISTVVSGTFVYRCDGGRSLMHPGSMLFGNSGACFECRHDHGIGDRCVSLRLSSRLFEEIASSAAGTSNFRFTTPSRKTNAWHDVMFARLGQGEAEYEEDVLSIAERVIGDASGHVASNQRVSATDERRMTNALRHAEKRDYHGVNLETLSSEAEMSKYHFLRVFRSAVGATPHQFLLSRRLARVTAALISSNEPITAIAFNAGFGDLSTFNHRFRHTFGMSPKKFRLRQRAYL